MYVYAPFSSHNMYLKTIEFKMATISLKRPLIIKVSKFKRRHKTCARIILGINSLRGSSKNIRPFGRIEKFTAIENENQEFSEQIVMALSCF